MPWENTEQYIRSGHRDAEDFQQGTLKTITLNEKEGIKAVVGKPKGKETMEVVSYLFEKDKGWMLEKAKAWFEKHHNPAKEHVYAVLPFTITEKIMEKPLRIRGVAMTAGMSRNFNIYTPEELQAFAGKLVEAPVYIEHVTTVNSVGKVAKTEWDGQRLWYEAEKEFITVLAAVYAICYLTGGSAVGLSFTVGDQNVSVANNAPPLVVLQQELERILSGLKPPVVGSA